MDDTSEILNSFEFTVPSNVGLGSAFGSASSNSINASDSVSDNDSTIGSRFGEHAVMPSQRKRGLDARREVDDYDEKLQSKARGKFKERIEVKMRKVEKGGSMCSVTAGSDMIHVPMNDERKSIVLDLMSKNKNFGEDADMDNPQTMMDHFKCLLIMSEAYTNNGHGKADKYPRYLSVLIGEDKCFDFHFQLKRSNRKIAEAFMKKYIINVKIHTQTIKVGGNRVPALQAPVKKRTSLIKKLTKDHMHGFNSYVALMQDLKSGKLKLPNPSSIVKIPSGLTLSSIGSPSPPFQHACGSSNSRTNHSHVGDPDSPFAPVREEYAEEC